MPKGVYDRTKTKEQREAEKNAAAKKAPVAVKATKTAAPAKKAPVAKSATKAQAEKAGAPLVAKTHTPKAKSEMSVTDRRSIVVDNLDVLITMRGAIIGNQGDPYAQVDMSHPTIKLLHTEIEENLKLFSDIREEMFGGQEEAIEPVVEEGGAAAEEPVETAPVAPPVPTFAAPAWSPPPPPPQD